MMSLDYENLSVKIARTALMKAEDPEKFMKYLNEYILKNDIGYVRT